MVTKRIAGCPSRPLITVGATVAWYSTRLPLKVPECFVTNASSGPEAAAGAAAIIASPPAPSSARLVISLMASPDRLSAHASAGRADFPCVVAGRGKSARIGYVAAHRGLH